MSPPLKPAPDPPSRDEYTIVRHHYNLHPQPAVSPLTMPQIMANLSNTRSVWGASSRQYRDAAAIAASYLASSASASLAEAAPRTATKLEKPPSAPSAGLNLALRPKPSPQK